MVQQVIGIGTAANDGTGDPVRTAFSKSKANFAELYSRVANATDVYGALPDGSTAIDSAITTAIAAGVTTLVFDQGTSFYRLTSTIAMPSGFSIVAGRGRPTIKMDNAANSRMFKMDGVTDASIRGITIDGNSSVTPTDACIIITNGATQCTIEDVHFVNTPSASTGSVVLSGTGTTRNHVRFCHFTDTEGTAVGISGGDENTIEYNEFLRCGSFGIFLNNGALRNTIVGNRSITSTLESIAMTYDCIYNRIVANHCESAGDNGISVSGVNNTVVANTCINNAGAGIGIWGSENSIVGNICKDNNFTNSTSYISGIWVHGNYGGTGSFNAIVGNTMDDDQASPTQNYGVRMHGSGYTTWATGQVISNLSDFTQLWRIYGLNIYKATNTGTTGATPPTHTSGTVSDGGVSWTYVNSFTTAVGTLWNHVADNIVRRSKTASYFDGDNWQRNVLFSSTTTSLTITADGLVKAKPT